MADIALTSAKIGIVYPEKAEIYDFIATEAITKGQAVYQLTTGKVGIADANASGKQQFRGIALNSAGAGQAVSVLVKGHIAGYTVSSLDVGAFLYLSDTAGKFADAAGTLEVRCGRVISLPDSALTQVVYIDTNWLTAWA